MGGSKVRRMKRPEDVGANGRNLGGRGGSGCGVRGDHGGAGERRGGVGRGFGIFGARRGPARTGRVPRSAERVEFVAPMAPTFKAGMPLKGQSSMKLQRNFWITQKTAWGLAHCVRKTFEDASVSFNGPVEV